MENINLSQEIQAFIAKSWGWIASIGVGVMAKVSTEILMRRKLTWIQWFGIIGISVFFGHLASTYCQYKNWTHQSHYIVPLATLFGEKIMIYITTNYKKMGDTILSYFQKSEK